MTAPDPSNYLLELSRGIGWSPKHGVQDPDLHKLGAFALLRNAIPVGNWQVCAEWARGSDCDAACTHIQFPSIVWDVRPWVDRNGTRLVVGHIETRLFESMLPDLHELLVGNRLKYDIYSDLSWRGHLLALIVISAGTMTEKPCRSSRCQCVELSERVKALEEIAAQMPKQRKRIEYTHEDWSHDAIARLVPVWREKFPHGATAEQALRASIPEIDAVATSGNTNEKNPTALGSSLRRYLGVDFDGLQISARRLGSKKIMRWVVVPTVAPLPKELAP